MNEQIYSFAFSAQDDLAAFPIIHPPRGGHITAIEKVVSHRSNATVGASTIDINAAGTEIIDNAAAGSASGSAYHWRSTHMGGANQPARFEKDELITLDIDHAGAGTDEHDPERARRIRPSLKNRLSQNTWGSPQAAASTRPPHKAIPTANTKKRQHGTMRPRQSAAS